MLSAKPNNENHSCPVCGDALRSQGESYDLRDIFAMWSPLAFPEQVIQEHMVIGKCTALYACPTCKVETFLPQIIGLPSFYAAASAGEWGGGDAGGYYEVTKWDFDEALRDVKPGASLIELGCGPGNFLKMAVARGGQVVGIEFNPHAMSVARSQGLTVYDASGIHEQEQKSFDAAFSFHVLEHVSDPMGFLASMKEHVRPGGVIGVSVPNQDGPIRFIQPCPMNMPPHHASRWQLRTFEVAAQRLGLSILRVAYEPLLLENHSYYSIYWTRVALPGKSPLARLARTILSLSLRAFFGLLRRSGLRYFPLLRGQSIYVLMARNDTL
ncbi:MAG: class I SAM-dependent methyltransferase [Hylemonella sp.]|nr:class I SAM-dependent methyltransferase [Hylemonella sp.]